MTALAGFWSFDAEANPTERCRRMLAAQEIYARSPAALWQDRGLALGRRLFPLVPEDRFDRGPVLGRDGVSALIADVRIDNRQELAAALGTGAPELDATCDAALLMRTLERWGEAALDRLVGDFAFAWWDAPRHRLLLARDYVGHRPLHYHQGAGFFAFASMPKGLHGLAEIPRAPDLRMAAEFVALLPEAPGSSFFEGVKAVPSGHLVTITRDGLRSRRYWTPDTSPILLRSTGEYVEALREKLDAAVAAMLRGTNGQVACHLSAGLDSSAVAATAARLSAPGEGRVVAYTSAPREGYDAGKHSNEIADEAPLAASVAALYPNMEHVVLRAPWREPTYALDRNFFLYDRPLLNLCNFAWVDAIHDAAKSRGLTVMLSGRKGNVGLSYSGMTLLPGLLASGRLVSLARMGLALAANGTRWGTIAAQSLGPFLPAPVWRRISRMRGRLAGLSDYSAIHPDAIHAHDLHERAAELGVDFSYPPQRNGLAHRLGAMRDVDLGNYKKGTLAGWGIDSRDPLSDRRLIEFCLRVPENQYLADGTSRALGKRTLADRLPPGLLSEPRKGYQGADWHEGLTAARGSIAHELERLSHVPVAAQTLDLDRMARSVEAWPSGSWHKDEVVREYRLALLRSVSVGHFLRKASGSNQ